MSAFGFLMASVHNDRVETRLGNPPDKLRKAGVGMPDNTLPDKLLISRLQDPKYRAADALSLACNGSSQLRRSAQFFSGGFGPFSGDGMALASQHLATLVPLHVP
ncbi:MAG: hypothetical protein ACREO0_05975 [Pseudoxanthomonas sp.]